MSKKDDEVQVACDVHAQSLGFKNAKELEEVIAGAINELGNRYVGDHDGAQFRTRVQALRDKLTQDLLGSDVDVAALALFFCSQAVTTVAIRDGRWKKPKVN